MSAVDAEGFRALFEPRGVLVAGVSTHPGKFGFVSLHNILSAGYAGAVYGTSREAGEVLGIPGTGRSFRCPMVAFFLFEPGGEGIVCERVYFDRATILEQLMGDDAAA